MLKALDRHVASATDQIVFVAPSVESVSDVFQNVEVDADRCDEIVRDVQRMRGAIYLKDGAIEPHQLTEDGRHHTSEDEDSWHMLLVDKAQRVTACALYREHDNTVTFDKLRARLSPLAKDAEWRPMLINAIDAELQRARQDDLHFVELGGWAVSETSRGTAGPLSLALAVYAFSRRAGGALGMTTATFRHCSATILKRLGGARFEVDGVTLPPYFDERYHCMMEMIRFDSRRPNAKYVSLIDQVRDALASITVIARPAKPAAEEIVLPVMTPAFARAALAS